jgi:hypothetical protein
MIKLLVEKGGAKVQYGEADLPTQQDQQVNNFNRGFGFNRNYNHNFCNDNFSIFSKLFLKPDLSMHKLDKLSLNLCIKLLI